MRPQLEPVGGEFSKVERADWQGEGSADSQPGEGGGQLSSQVAPVLRLVVAGALGTLVMGYSSRVRLVADVAEDLPALCALQRVYLGLLLVDLVTMRTLCTEFEVDVVRVRTDVFIFQLLSDLLGHKRAGELLALRALFEVFLALGDAAAHPAELSVALDALAMGTLGILPQLVIEAALIIWAGLRAVLEKNSVESLLCLFVALLDIVDALEFLELIKEVQSVTDASLKGVIPVFAV